MTSTTDVTDLAGDDTHDEHNEQDDGHGKHHPRRTYDVTVRTPAALAGTSGCERPCSSTP